MNLLYATSIVLPSALANRRQTLAMAAAFHKEVGNEFVLGIAKSTESLPSYAVELGVAPSPVLALRYLRLIKERGITAVYTREDRLLFLLWLFAKCMRLPLTFYIEVHAVRKNYFADFALRHADGVIVVTEGLKRDLAPRRGLVAHDAVNLDSFADAPSRDEARTIVGIPSDAYVVAYVGRYTTMGAGKGVDELIEALAEARAREQRLHLLIVGLTEDERKALEVRVEVLGIPSHARTLVTYVEQAELPTYLRAADLLVMNFPNTPHYAHHMSPMKLFEYMAAGVPILTTDLPSVREVLDDQSARFIPPGDAPALVEALVEAPNDTTATARAVRARELVGQYTWEERAKAILAFMRG